MSDHARERGKRGRAGRVVQKDQVQITAAKAAVQGFNLDPVRGKQFGFRNICELNCFYRPFVKHLTAEKRPECFGGGKFGNIDIKL